jgi:hypothetical protein
LAWVWAAKRRDTLRRAAAPSHDLWFAARREPAAELVQIMNQTMQRIAPAMRRAARGAKGGLAPPPDDREAQPQPGRTGNGMKAAVRESRKALRAKAARIVCRPPAPERVSLPLGKDEKRQCHTYLMPGDGSNRDYLFRLACGLVGAD